MRERLMRISDLPDDLEVEILSRVPSKSLWVLKTTCKRWYALFRDPKFVKKNEKLGQAARESMLHSNFRVYSIAEDLHGIHKNGVNPPSIDFTGKLRNQKHSKDLKISKIFHCEGLMLCSTKGNTKGNTRLVVWNPCTGQTRSIEPRTRYRREDTYALGYVSSPSSRSYKILRCCYYKNKEKVSIAEFEIYELCSGSWRVLDYLTSDFDICCDGVSLKGDTYWVSEDKETDFFLLKFDFTTERFVHLPLPFQSFNPQVQAAISVVKDEKLSVLHQDFLAWSNVMRIWVTNKVDDAEGKDLAWRSDFVLVVDFDKFNLTTVTEVTSFLLDEENKVAVCCHKDCCYDEDMTNIYIVGEDMYKQVYEETTKRSHLNWTYVLAYVPSLVRI